MSGVVLGFGFRRVCERPMRAATLRRRDLGLTVRTFSDVADLRSLGLLAEAAGMRLGFGAGLRVLGLAAPPIVVDFLRTGFEGRVDGLRLVPRVCFEAARRTVLLPIFLEGCLNFIATTQSGGLSNPRLGPKD